MVTLVVVPAVRNAGHHIDARLVEVVVIVGLIRGPVRVRHQRQMIAVRVGGLDSPDERRLTARIDALTCRPEEHPVTGSSLSKAFTQRRLCNITIMYTA